MIDFDPGDIYRAYSVSASVDMLSPTPSGTVSFDFEVGGGPTIAATYSSDSDYCDWSINQFWLFGQPLDGSLFKLGTSWASYATYAATDVKFRGTLIGPTGVGVNTPWKYVSVRYDY